MTHIAIYVMTVLFALHLMRLAMPYFWHLLLFLLGVITIDESQYSFSFCLNFFKNDIYLLVLYKTISYNSLMQLCFTFLSTFQAELIDPAVKGTLNVLGSCVKTPSVKKVVVTSSMAAVAYNERPRTPDVVVDETWFSSSELCRQTKVCARTSVI